MKDFLFHSRDQVYRNPFGAIEEGNSIHFLFPLAQFFHAQGVRIAVTKTDEQTVLYDMRFCKSENGYDYFEYDLTITSAGIYWYYFEIPLADKLLRVGRDESGRAILGENPPWQITVYKKDFKTPDFIKGGIIYHIFVDRFCKSGNCEFHKNGVLKQWDNDVTVCDPDGVFRANDFYGGNFRGIIEKLDYLQSLNVRLLYLSPIFESWSNHRYDTADYLKIDELLGSEEDFRELIEKAEEKGIFIMLDGVFNHTGADSVYFNKENRYPEVGAYQSRQSPYSDWYRFRSYPDEYDCWWGVKVSPTVNKDAQGYRELIFGKDGVFEKWNAFGIKGWRLDVVDELPTDFVKQIRKAVKPDKLLIGEVWEDASTKVSYGSMRPYLLGESLDGTMNYPFKDIIIEFVLTGVKRKFIDGILNIMENYPRQCLDCSMNFLGTHDTVRILNVFADIDVNGMNKQQRAYIRVFGDRLQTASERLKMAAAIQFTLPGVPTIYYGDEVGLDGYEDPLNRKPFPWGNENVQLLEFYRKLSQIRKDYQKIWLGEYFFQDDSEALSYDIRSKSGSLEVRINHTHEAIEEGCEGEYLELISGKKYCGKRTLPPKTACIFYRKHKM